MGGKTSRTKGHSFERWVAKTLRKWYPDAWRGKQERDAMDSADVEGTPWYIECKRDAKHLSGSVDTLMKKAEEASTYRPAMLVWKFDGQKPMVAMRFETFIEIIAKWKHEGGK